MTETCDEVAPPGYKWVTVQEPVTVTEWVAEQVIIDGRPVTPWVQRTRTEMRSVRRLVPVESVQGDAFADLKAQVENLQKALGLANVDPAEAARIQQDLDAIKKRLGLNP